MNTKQLGERLGRRDRGNRDWTSRRVKVGVGSWDRPRPWEGTELPFLNCEVERREQLGGKHGGVEPRVQVCLCLSQCFSLFAYVKSKPLEVSIVGPGQPKCFVEREYCPIARLRVCTRE